MDIIEIKSLVDLVNAHPYLAMLGVIWVTIWKGLALWRAVEYKARGWFIVILVVNTLGLLEIIYLFFVTKPKASEASSSATSS